MRKRSRKNKEGTSYWQSYSDMMAALLLMFVLIMTFTILQSLRHYQEMSESIDKARLDYEQQQKELEEQTRKAEEQQQILVAQQKTLEEQKVKMDEQQAQIDKLIGVKSELIKALSDEFSETDLAIEIDAQTGSIVLDSSILFDFNRYELKSEAKTFLKNFLPIYFNVLMSEEFAEYIGEIIIEGYTDDSGTYIYNLNLSQKRAFAIAEYCLEPKNKLFEGEELEKLQALLTANGKSKNNLILDENGKVNSTASRRVELKFRLKDEEMIQAMKEILGN